MTSLDVATQGYAVETAGAGADAPSAVRRARPDLVLLDDVAKPFDFSHLDRVVAVALSREPGPAGEGALAQTVADVVARMREPARTAIGGRMQEAALAVDLTAADRARVEGALERARPSPPAGR